MNSSVYCPANNARALNETQMSPSVDSPTSVFGFFCPSSVSRGGALLPLLSAVSIVLFLTFIVKENVKNCPATCSRAVQVDIVVSAMDKVVKIDNFVQQFDLLAASGNSPFD